MDEPEPVPPEPLVLPEPMLPLPEVEPEPVLPEPVEPEVEPLP